MVQVEDKQNVELIDLSKQILELTKEVRALTRTDYSGSSPTTRDSARR